MSLCRSYVDLLEPIVLSESEDEVTEDSPERSRFVSILHVWPFHSKFI